MIRHARHTALLPLALLALAAACGGGDRAGDKGARGGDAGGDAGGTPERGGTAVVAELSDISKPISIVSESSLDGDMLDVMYMSLARGAWRDGRLVYLNASESPMALARRWELTGPDSASLRYYMRSDVAWSDGRPLTAHDVKWTYDMVAIPEVASPRLDYASYIDSVQVENDSTVVFHFKRRYPEALFYSNLQAAPRHAFEGVEPANLRNAPRLTDPANGNLPVSGAFMIGAWNKGERVTLVPNPRFQPRPYLDQIVIQVIPEVTTRLVELETQRVDMTRPIPTERVEDLRARAPFIRFEREARRSYDYVGYNPRGYAPFADREIRTALGMAIDARGIIQALRLGDFGEPAGGPYSPIFADLHDPRGMAPLPYDTARAKQILAARGWRDADGDGIVEKDGRPFRFTLLTNSGNARRGDVSQIIQQQWKRIGVDARLQLSETNTFFDRLRAKDFQATLAGWSVALSPDLGSLWGPESPFNFVSYDNQSTFALFERARGETTPERANALWKQAAAQIVADRPYTWLYFLDTVIGVNERLRNTKIDTYGAYQNTWEWWIPRERQRGAAAAPAPGAAPRDTGAK